jgi:hypothetical protein
MTTTLEKPTEGFIFDEKKHQYWLDGRLLQGVTSILGVVAKPALIQWAANMACDYIEESCQDIDWSDPEHRQALLNAARKAHAKKRDKAADDGTDLHALIEDYVNEWAMVEDIRFIAAEQRLYSRDLGIAGTCDLVFEKDGKTYIGDIKTYKKLWDRLPMLQCAAYGLMWEGMMHDQQLDDIATSKIPLEGYSRKNIDGYCVIRIKDNDFEVKWSYDVEGDREGFLAALKLYRTLQNWS